MQAFLVSDQEPTSARVREVLLREGYDCSASAHASLDAAANRLAQDHPELVVVVLSPDPDNALTVLSDISRQRGIAHVLAVGPTTATPTTGLFTAADDTCGPIESVHRK